jgi:arsenite-transporting ATPase
VSSVRLVANPERMVIEEARRAYTYLQLYGYPIDAVVVNRILPEEAATGPFGRYVERQRAYLDEIEATFAPLPILRVPHLGEEVFGLDLLRRIGDALYGDTDPTAVLHAERSYEVTKDADAYVLRVRLPIAHVGDLSVKQYGDQLVMQIANQRRNWLLPKFLAFYKLAETRVGDGWLRARFVPAT